MNRRTLKRIFVTVVSFFATYAALGLVWGAAWPESSWFDLYKSMVPLVVAVPAAVLAAAFQRRVSYISALRDLWKLLLPAVQKAIQYTHLTKPNQTQFGEVQEQLATVIDGLRGVFKNVGESGKSKGLYPYENLKDIHQIISRLRFGDTYGKMCAPATARKCIVELWKEMHEALLLEFDREEPLDPVSKYLFKGRSIADDLFEGTLHERCLQQCEEKKCRPSEGCGRQPQTTDQSPSVEILLNHCARTNVGRPPTCSRNRPLCQMTTPLPASAPAWRGCGPTCAERCARCGRPGR